MTPTDFARRVRRLASRLHHSGDLVRTQRALDALPADIRKDIGWPDRFDGRGPFRL